MVQADSTLIERLVARRIRKLIEPHQCLTDQPDDVSEDSSVLVEDRVFSEQRAVPGNASVKITERQSDVSDPGKIPPWRLLLVQELAGSVPAAFEECSEPEFATEPTLGVIPVSCQPLT